jgi:hypothetical protein
MGWEFPTHNASLESQDFQPKMEGERIEVPVIVEKFDIRLNTISRDQGIEWLANRDPLSTQLSVILGGLNRKRFSTQANARQLRQQSVCAFEITLMAESLQNFQQDQIARHDRAFPLLQQTIQ